MATRNPNRKCSCGCGRPGRYLGRLEIDGDAHFLGYFATKQERADARAAKRRELAGRAAKAKLPPGERITVREYIADVLERMEDGRLRTGRDDRRFKSSSIGEARGQLARFERSFDCDRPLAAITRHDAIRHGRVNQAVVAVFNRAVDEELIQRNPFRGLTKRGAGRSNERPPTVAEWERLYESCSVLGDRYAPQMRALMLVAAYTGMRPSEIYAVEWDDVDLDGGEIYVQRRLYRGTIDLPKSNRVKTIALPEPAEHALRTLPSLDTPPAGRPLVFRSKRGKRLQASTLGWYWEQVCEDADLDFDFYLATKHYVHLLWKLGASRRAIATQMGWSEQAVEGLLEVYGHNDVAALEEIKALHRKHNLRTGAQTPVG